MSLRFDETVIQRRQRRGNKVTFTVPTCVTIYPFFWQFMTPYIPGCAITLISVPLLCKLAHAKGLYDLPDAGLKPHQRPIPYLGGVGIWLGWMSVLLYAMIQQGANYHSLSWIAVGGSMLMLIGLMDDLSNLPPKLRLLAQAAVAIFVLYGKLGKDLWASLSSPFQEQLPGWLTGDLTGSLIGGGFCILLLAGATNATNLIDGLDGLCGGVIGICSLGFWTLGLLFWQRGGGSSEDLSLNATLAAGIVGACSGFLAYNFQPASVFMGDSGSLLLGFNVAVLMGILTQQHGIRGLIGSIFVFGFPIFDTALAIARRGLNRRPLFVGDRSHFYDQLRDRGWSVRRTVYACYGISIFCGAIGCAGVYLPRNALAMTVIGVPILTVVACLMLGLLRVDNAAERSGQLPPSSAGQ